MTNLKNLLIENYSKYFNDLLSGERSLRFGLLVSLMTHFMTNQAIWAFRPGRFRFTVGIKKAKDLGLADHNQNSLVICQIDNSLPEAVSGGKISA